MTTRQIEAEIGPDELLKAVAQLNRADLEKFVSDVIALRARRNADSLPKEEAVLLSLINQGMPVEIQGRYDELTEKRRSETLTLDEHKELLRLTALVERFQAQRVGYLVELASIRDTTLTNLMNDPGIRMPDHA